MKKRILTVALVIALLATCFAGTYAYLQDQEEQVNTFTVGNVTISLDETKVTKNDAGNLVSTGERTTEDQSYKLFPAMVVDKDPTITVDSTSENAWIAAKITVSGTDVAMLQYLSGGALKNGSADVVIDGNVAYIYVKAIKAANDKVVLFEKLTVPTEWNNTQLAEINNMKITVDAYAVQANGFANCQAAMQAAFPNAFPAAN